MKKLIPAIICLFLAVPCGAKTIYVDADAIGPNNGSSWTNAYNYLQNALADANSAAKPVEIRVAQGIYTPDSNSAEPNGSGDRTATFQLINGVALKGGYAGVGEADPNARDIELYETILTGDINTPDVNTDNSYHVVTGSETDPNAVLDGFVITAGYANGPRLDYHHRGGGMLNRDGSPTLTNCTFSANMARNEGDGGGMYNDSSSPTLTNCTFTGNWADDEGYGGAMCNRGGSPTLTDCNFSENLADEGGGMFNWDSNSTLTNCTFSGNWASGEGVGGGMYNGYGSPILTNCSFNGNSADYKGGGMYNYESDPTLTNCTFVDNSASQQGGGMHDDDSRPTLTNCVLWGNTPDEIYPEDDQPRITYSDVQGGWPGEGNINADPCFADPDSNDYHLKSQAGRWEPATQAWIVDDVTSPCIDAGDMASPIGYEPFPNGGIINMGAYGGTAEASKSYFGEPLYETIVAGDINGDCKVNYKDFAFMALHWLQDNSP